MHFGRTFFSLVFFLFLAHCQISCQARISHAPLFSNDPYIGRKLDELWDEAHKHYIREIPDTPEEHKKFFESILRGGITDYLGQHSRYLTAKEYQEEQQIFSGMLEGSAGLELKEIEGAVVVSRIMPESPADRSGAFQKDDAIVMVGTESVRGQSMKTVVEKIRGSKGEPVVITIERNGTELPPVTLIREVVIIPSVTAYSVGPFLYMRIERFDALTAYQEFGAYEEYIHTFTGLILDLRQNAGGLISSVQRASCPFSESSGDIVVTSRGRDRGAEKVYKADKVKCSRLRDLPVVVLIDGDTVSAAEILAGVIRDWRHAPLVGETTYGKGVTQDIVALDDGDALVIVSTEYFVGNSSIAVNEKGLTPDYEIEGEPNFDELSKDVQFQKALDVLEQEVEKRKGP